MLGVDRKESNLWSRKFWINFPLKTEKMMGLVNFLLFSLKEYGLVSSNVEFCIDFRSFP
jgi:hypothetical protein